MNGDRRNLERGILLFKQGRHADAEREFRQSLVDSVGDGNAHAWLALALLEQKKPDDAEREAGEAIVNEPDLPWTHYVMACVHRERKRLPRAHGAIDEAIALDGGMSSLFHATKAHLYLMQSRHRDALASADAALAIDPSDEFALNVRALAQTNLGMKQEAVATIRGALEQNPEDAFTHANHGWAMLHQNRPREALDHFAEALKLDPGNEFARHGLVEALKAKNPIYRVMLAYFLWSGRQTGAVRAIVFVAAFVGPRIFRTIGNEHPQYRTPAYVAAGLLTAFVLMTWLATPIFDSLLRLHPRGRYALSDDQRRGSTLFIAFVALLLAIAGFGLAMGESAFVFVALVAALILLPLSAIYRAPAGWPRGVLVACVVVLIALLTMPVWGVMLGVIDRDQIGLVFTSYLVSAFGSQFLAMAMVRRS